MLILTNSSLKNNWFFISSKSTSKIGNTVSTPDTANVNRIHNNVTRSTLDAARRIP